MLQVYEPKLWKVNEQICEKYMTACLSGATKFASLRLNFSFPERNASKEENLGSIWFQWLYENIPAVKFLFTHWELFDELRDDFM